MSVSEFSENNKNRVLEICMKKINNNLHMLFVKKCTNFGEMIYLKLKTIIRNLLLQAVTYCYLTQMRLKTPLMLDNG